MRLLFPLVRLILLGLALLPLPVLYLFSRVEALVLYRFAKYRRSVVLENLVRAFPDREESFIRETAIKFYKHLGELNAEFLKIPALRRTNLRKRVRIVNPELIDQLLEHHSHLIAVGSHMNNWEWGGLALSDLFPRAQINGVYKPLKNPLFDRYFRDVRKRFGMHLIPMKATLRAVVSAGNMPSITVLISDQSPTFGETEFIAPFMGVPVPVFLGAEKIARLTGFPVIYLAMHKIRRGRYEIVIEVVSTDPKSEEMYAITQRHLRMLEAEIRFEPEHWLWSHRRWKHTGKAFSDVVVMT